jgi:predicted 3-demethylubiquinone-9 3-methyltransferase (glyoxalase superfamily)
MQKIMPCISFEAGANAAMRFYSSVFQDAEIGVIHHAEGDETAQAGDMTSGIITLCGQDFRMLDGIKDSPELKLTEAISLHLEVGTQEEIDYYWEALLADGGQPSVCGRLRDKFGVSWQIIPKVLGELMRDPDQQKSMRVASAALKMQKIVINDLKWAAGHGA